MQTLSFARVPSVLQPYIGTIYSGIAEPGPTHLPALMAQLWVCTFPVYWQAPGQDTAQRLPPVVLMGPILGSNTVYVQQQGLIIGIGFWPRGWSEMVRMPAGELANTMIDATAVWPDLCDELLQRAAAAPAWKGKAEALTRFCKQLLVRSRERGEAQFIRAIDQWLAGNHRLDALSSTLHLSPRQIERRVMLSHGASPRLLRSRQRALRAAARHAAFAAAPQTGPAHTIWAEYADQSHFIRDFRRFIGGVPSAFGRDNGIGYSVVAKSWRGDEDHPLSVYRQDA